MVGEKYTRPRTKLTADITRAVKVESGHECSIKGCMEHTYLEIHHINENREDNRIENLILLCRKHHMMSHHNVIDKKSLREYKKLNALSPLSDLTDRFEKLESLVAASSLTNENQSSSVTSINLILEEGRLLGNNLRGSTDGNRVSSQIFNLIRKHGNLMGVESINLMVARDESYSRTGLSGLGVLYDTFFEHIKSLQLIEYYESLDLQGIAYYCALREHYKELRDFSACMESPNFEYNGLVASDSDYLISKYPNRGPSVVLDSLVHINTQKS